MLDMCLSVDDQATETCIVTVSKLVVIQLMVIMCAQIGIIYIDYDLCNTWPLSISQKQETGQYNLFSKYSKSIIMFDLMIPIFVL